MAIGGTDISSTTWSGLVQRATAGQNNRARFYRCRATDTGLKAIRPDSREAISFRAREARFSRGGILLDAPYAILLRRTRHFLQSGHQVHNHRKLLPALLRTSGPASPRMTAWDKPVASACCAFGTWFLTAASGRHLKRGGHTCTHYCDAMTALARRDGDMVDGWVAIELFRSGVSNMTEPLAGRPLERTGGAVQT